MSQSKESLKGITAAIECLDTYIVVNFTQKQLSPPYEVVNALSILRCEKNSQHESAQPEASQGERKNQLLSEALELLKKFANPPFARKVVPLDSHCLSLCSKISRELKEPVLALSKPAVADAGEVERLRKALEIISKEKQYNGFGERQDFSYAAIIAQEALASKTPEKTSGEHAQGLNASLERVKNSLRIISGRCWPEMEKHVKASIAILDDVMAALTGEREAKG